MKRTNMILAIIVCMSMIVSCMKITDTPNGTATLNPNGEHPILFSQQTKAQTTSVSGNGYDEFKLFVWNSLNDTIMKPYSVAATDVNEYHYENIPGQELKYYRKAADWYDFIGIIPTDHEMSLKNGSVKINGVKSFTVDDKLAEKAANITDTLYWSEGLAVSSPEEFLTAYKRVEKEKYNGVVELPFKHQNAVVFIGFSSNKSTTKLLDYVPKVPQSKTTLNQKKRMFDLMAEGKLVGYPFVPTQETMGGYYTGQKGNFFNIGPNQSFITQERMEELMPLVNAQFVYTDENGVVIDKDWIFGENRKDKVFIAFADGVNAADFISGKDALWENLTDEEKSDLTNYKESGCRALRINKNSDDNKYYIWGESYGTYMPTTSRYFTIINKEIPAIEGVRMFTADSLGVNTPTDTLYCKHIAHTTIADADVNSTGCNFNNTVTSNEVIQYSLPETVMLNDAPVWSPTTFYAIPCDSGVKYLVVKLSYIYDGITTYDVRVPIKLPENGLQAGKYYKYELHITTTGNGTEDANEARNEKDEIIIEGKPVISVKLIETGYIKGDSRKLTI